MLSDVDNVRKLMDLLGDDGFVETLTNVEQLVEDVDDTLDRVEEIEDEANEAVREANDALNAVDHRLQKVDETIRLTEAKIEAGFSAGFFFFAFQQFQAGAIFIATGLFIMGLLGSSSLVVTVINMPQVQRLWEMGLYLANRLDEDESEEIEVEIEAREAAGRSDRERESDGEPGPTIDWRTKDGRRDRKRGDGQRDRASADSESGRDGPGRGS
jgi:hypothetical protein